MRIGKIRLETNLVLAPMFRVTTLPFRLLCKKYGCGLVFSEMLNGNAIERNNRSALRQTFSSKEEKPVAMQLFGTDKKILLAAAEKLDADIIDFNCGCPDSNIVRQGAGAALLKRSAKIGEIVEFLAAGLDRPLTVKIRTGIDSNHINAVEIARIIEEAGASAISVHGRTMCQGYTGKADWTVIKDVKDAVSIPVIANGDIKDEASAKSCLELTGADGLMIGRAAMGEPYIFQRINYYLKTGKIQPAQPPEERIKDFFSYLELSKKHNCLNYADLKMHAQWFTKSIRGAVSIRRELSRAKTSDEIERIMNKMRG